MIFVAMQVALAAAVLFLSATASLAGREPEEWDDLPDVEAISFSANAVGLAMAGGEYYLVDRSTDRVRELSRQEFEQAFAGAVGSPVAEVKEETGIGSTVLLRTSGAREFTARDAYCSEGEDIQHALFMDGAVVKDQVGPCVSISCAEIVAGNLWLGTRYDGEYGEYPANGIVVQSLDGGHWSGSWGPSKVSPGTSSARFGRIPSATRFGSRPTRASTSSIASSPSASRSSSGRTSTRTRVSR